MTSAPSSRPRDIVARAIDHEIKRDGLDYVHLDISHREPDFVKAHFPNIYEKLLGLGIDITKSRSRSCPAQHYTCGGVLVDIDGRTDAPGLYAAGEVTQRASRRQPAGLEQPARMLRVRRGGGASTSSQCWDDLPDVPPSARGTKAASPTATRKS